MTTQVKAIPDGYATVTPHLTVDNAAAAIEFYGRAFGAETMVTMPGPGGRLMHAEIKIGNSIVMLADEMPEGGGKSPKTLGASTGGLMIYVEDCDALFARAVAAGATVKMPLMDMFWGDRYGQLADPFGYSWSIATHKEDLSPEEMERRMAAAFAAPAQ